MEVRIADIENGARKRSVDTAKVAQLAHSISQVGLIHPITVEVFGSHYRLLAGAHRLEAFRILERETIPANVIEVDELEAELIQIDENLIHNELTALEQGEHLQRRNEILEAMGKRAPDHRPNKGETVSPLLKTTADIAAEMGVSERSAQQRMQVARNILPEVKEIVRNTEIGDSITKLLDLARMEPDEQREVAQEIASGGMKHWPANPPKEKKDIDNPVLYSSDSEEWYTPPHIIERVVSLFGSIDLDPCSNPGAPRVPAAGHFTQLDDGLSKEWHGKVYMNPPYGREIVKWIEYLCKQYESGNVTEAVALVPSRTDTAWFLRMRDYLKCFVTGRLSFSDNETSAPFPSVAIYFGNNKQGFIDTFSDIGDVYERCS